jgi:DNA-binding transcriptional MerR regulator
MQVVDTYFSYRDVARIFGLKESRLRYWAQTGFINPSAKHEGRRVYAFSDLVEIKAAKELLDNGIPLQRVRRNLRALREALPGTGNLLARLRVRSDGETLVVVEGQTALDPVSGQTFLDFEIRDLGQEVAEVLALAPRADAAPERAEAANRAVSSTEGSPSRLDADRSPQPKEDDQSAYGFFVRGLAADGDPAREDEALAAYQQAVELDPGLAAAHTNMGNIYHRRGDRSAALRCYEAACALDPDQPEGRYNLANILRRRGTSTWRSRSTAARSSWRPTSPMRTSTSPSRSNRSVAASRQFSTGSSIWS